MHIPGAPWGKLVMEAEGQLSRGNSIEATGLQLEQAVPPVLHGHPEVVDGAPEDEELMTLQGEVCTPSNKSLRSFLQFKRAQMRPVRPAWKEEGRKKGDRQENLLQPSRK